ncbi:hypothetical protein BH24ACT22_BH24ACT22_10160 [soil metagenome]
MGYDASPPVKPLSSPVLRLARVLEVPIGDGASIYLDLELLEGPLQGERVSGVFYRYQGVVPEMGETVTANTLGLEMGLGTGGVAIVFPTSGGTAPENDKHFVKLPYTPLQAPAAPPEQAESLEGVPVVVLPLHSHLAPACCAVAALMPDCRVSFVWQEGGALPVAFSKSVRQLQERDLLHKVVSAGNCFGGDVEAPNIYSGLLTAAEVSEVILTGIGPGVVGTEAPYGHGGMAAAIALNAACSLGAEPVLAPRISVADSRSRHHGISHHTRSVLQSALGDVRVALPVSEADISTVEFPERHHYLKVPFKAAGLEERFGVTFESMGRVYTDDEVFFNAAAAAVALALGGVE